MSVVAVWALLRSMLAKLTTIWILLAKQSGVSAMQIHWWNVAKNELADGRRLIPGTDLRLRSEHHLDPPIGYVVNELVPKIFHKWRGSKPVRVTGFGSVPASGAPLESVYWSDEDWPLGDPTKQETDSIFRPAFEGGSRGFPFEAAIIRSAYHLHR